MSIAKSIFGLAKYNNGLFKSEKQRDFLISKIKQNGGLIGHSNSGYHTCPIFASYDDKGITKIVKHRSTKKGHKSETMFTRKDEMTLKKEAAQAEARGLEEIKQFEDEIRQMEEELKEVMKVWEKFNREHDGLELSDVVKKRINADYKEMADSRIATIEDCKNDIANIKKHIDGLKNLRAI